jgi:hypothetical protein
MIVTVSLAPVPEKLEEGYDLVIGNRFSGGIMPGAVPSHHRRAFRKDAIQRLNLSCTGMEFASEMVIKATLHGLRITEIPTALRPDGRSRRPHLRSFRDGWRHLKLMLMLSPRWLLLIPGWLLLICGLILMSLIGFSGGLPLGGTLLGVNTSIAAAMTAIVGFQILLNGVFARRHFTSTGTHLP